MNPTEAAQLLAHAAAFDNRKPSAAASTAWAAALHDVPLDEDATAAIARFYGTADEHETGQKWIQPHHVRQHRKALRAERLGPEGPGLSGAIPAADPDDIPAYLAALRRQETEVADGAVALPAIEAGTGRAAWKNPNVRRIREMFDAEQAASRERQAAEKRAEREATRAYIDAQETLLTLDDLGQAAMTRAWDELFGEEQAAAEFPLAADALGVTDQQKTVIRAARLITEAKP